MNPTKLRPDAIGNIRPTCAVCGRPVETFRIEYDSLYRVYHCIAACHGEIEECDLDERAVAAQAVSSGVAFTNSRRLKNQRRIDDRS